MMEPIRFEPILKRIRWGGRKLGTVLGKPIGPEEDYAESWEIADHADGRSRVAEGPLAGRTLHELLAEYGSSVFGRDHVPEQFPLLIKFLDANDWLSLQVHPDDSTAKLFNPAENGKTEAWVIVRAEPGSEICAGLRAGVTQADLADAIRRSDFSGCLNRYRVEPGDCVFVPAGTVHALGPGIVLAEIQQQSNLTFRLYDWGRTGRDGQQRPIHVEESLKCTDFHRGPVNPVRPQTVHRDGAAVDELVRCDHFAIDRCRSDAPFVISTNESFRIIMMLEGTADARASSWKTRLTRGTTLLIPAACETLQVTPNGPVTLLEVWQE